MFANVIRLSPRNHQPTSLTESRISFSAAGVRGLTIHLKATGCLLKQIFSCLKACTCIYMITLTTYFHGWLRVWPWWYCPGHQLVVWCHRVQEDRLQLSIRSCWLNVFLDKFWGNILWDDMLEYIECTDRRPKPNVIASASIALRLSFPSFRYRSGWNAVGLG